MELDPVASRIVLDNLRAALPTQWAAKAAELRSVAAASPSGDVTLPEFLSESGLELEDVYGASRTWSDLREAAGLPTAPPGPHERLLRRACARLLHVDDLERLETYRSFLSRPVPPSPAALPERERRLLRMLVASVTDRAVDRSTSLAAGAALLWSHPQVLHDLSALFDALLPRIDHVHTRLPDRPDVPLQVHARYTRRELLAALASGTGAHVTSWQQGVRWLPHERTDVLAFTLDKTTGHFSPTTRYRDYAISRDLIHWESQSITREASETGQRYQHHATLGTSILLFARLNTAARAFWFLGPARYVSHRSERPMAVTWRLTHPLPGDLFAAFAAAVA